jgi:hypothetical protein
MYTAKSSMEPSSTKLWCLANDKKDGLANDKKDEQICNEREV